jgi:hypothetical protein
MVILPYRRKAFRPIASSLDSDVADWQTRVIAAGSSVSGSQLTAVNTFVLGLKSNSLWTKINRLNTFCGTNLTAALVPLKVGSGDATDGNTSFVSGDYTETTGLVGDASTKRLETGVSILGLTKSDFGMGVFVLETNNTALYRIDIGSSYTATGNTSRFYLGLWKSSGSPKALFGMGNLFRDAQALSTSTGLLAMETTSTTTMTVYKSGSSVFAGGDWYNTGFLAGTIRVFMGGGGYHTGNRLGGYYIGNNLNQSLLSAAFETLKTNLGR